MINGMNLTRVVVANELRSYRQVLARAFGNLRSNVEVSAVEPEDLDGEVKRLRPGFVVCSRATPAVESRVPIWVELYPDHQAHSRVGLRGVTTTVEDMQFDDLLALLDRSREGLAAPG